ncbi:MAG: serine/threonine-protein phosphatase [Paludibacteraceae bacterium]|nr:serine/threonine-protein phosphatase [Paludibacteraceae bacterium]
MSVKVRISARCEAAGRPNNEDNYLVCEDLAANKWGFQSDKVLELGAKGTLLLVCDGMGGMNAGEVASAIATETIKQWFATDRLTDAVLADDISRCDYIRRAIQAADTAIKTEGQRDAAKRGMGSTAVMVWLLDCKAYVGWCGDSRAYKFNSQIGLEQMSHDHSYVQELVDKGQLSAELAFDHPNNNIITRSLGDPRGLAQPDTAVFALSENDIVLLCSDGLCGVLRDNEIESIIRLNTTSMEMLRDTLWEVSRPKWHDNVTIVLAQVVGGQQSVFNNPQGYVEASTNNKDEQQANNKDDKQQANNPQQNANAQTTKRNSLTLAGIRIPPVIFYTICLLLIAILAAAAVLLLKDWNRNDNHGNKKPNTEVTQEHQNDAAQPQSSTIDIDKQIKNTEFSDSTSLEQHIDSIFDWIDQNNDNLASKKEGINNHLTDIGNKYGDNVGGADEYFIKDDLKHKFDSLVNRVKK